MNVELTIQHLFEQAPTIFKDRIDALNHLFCVIGNDFAWKNGELVENDFEFTKDYIQDLSTKLVNGKAHQHNLLSLRAEAEIYYDEFCKKNNETCLEILGVKKTKEEYLSNFSNEKYHMEEKRRERKDGTFTESMMVKLPLIMKGNMQNFGTIQKILNRIGWLLLKKRNLF